jgi:pimeloyl-ACP methyl ester carboxylesterase
MKNLITVDLKKQLKNIKIGTLIIWGKKDKATPLSDAYIMQKEIAGSKLVVINNASHSPHMTHPQDVANAIERFV